MAVTNSIMTAASFLSSSHLVSGTFGLTLSSTISLFMEPESSHNRTISHVDKTSNNCFATVGVNSFCLTNNSNLVGCVATVSSIFLNYLIIIYYQIVKISIFKEYYNICFSDLVSWHLFVE